MKFNILLSQVSNSKDEFLKKFFESIIRSVVSFCLTRFLNSIMELGNSETWRFVNENYTNHKLLYLQKTDLYILNTKMWRKKFKVTKVNKNFSKYMYRKLKYHLHWVRSEIGISLEIILNVSECLTLSLVPLKFLYWQ